MAILEVQKAAVHFLSRVLEKARKRENVLRIEDLIEIFKHQPKYIDLCARKLILFQLNHKYTKKKRNQETTEKDDKEDS